MRFVLGALAAGAALVAALVGLNAAGFYPNLTDSMPRGVWRLTGAPIARGRVVLVCPPLVPAVKAAKAAGYLIRGACPGAVAPLLKPVVAVAGDRVEVSAAGVFVNGRLIANSGLIERDGKGRALPRGQLGSHRVPQGRVWLVSSHNRYSFDSRYFGPVPASQVRGVAAPVWLLGD